MTTSPYAMNELHHDSDGAPPRKNKLRVAREAVRTLSIRSGIKTGQTSSGDPTRYPGA